MASLCCLLLLFLSATAVAGQFYAYTSANIGGNCPVDCVIPCGVRTGDGKALPLPPQVTWQRAKVNNLSQFLDLSDSFWREVENIKYTRQGFTKCTERRNGSAVFYRCSFCQKACSIEDFRGYYRCIVRTAHTVEKFSLTQNILFPSHVQDVSLPPPCFAPTPSGFSAFYNESVGTVELNWITDVPPPGVDYCYNSQFFTVLVRIYTSYNAYTGRRAVRILDFAPTAEPGGTQFIVNPNDFHPGSYYVFNMRSNYVNLLLEDQLNSITSPLFFFGSQTRASLSYPVTETLTLRAVIGNSVELRCEGKGTPTPTVSLLRRGMYLARDTSTPSNIARRTLVVTYESAGLYSCIATNTIVQQPQGGAIPEFVHKTIIVQVEDVVQVNNGEFLCAPNGETACAPYFSNSPVLVNTTDIDFMIFVDNAVGTLMSFELNATASLVANCFKLAQAMLCHSAFPFCSSTNRGTTREVCKNTCDVFGPGGVCENVVAWEELFPDIYELMLSNCDTRVNPGGSSPECVHVSLENTGPQPPTWCNRGDGQTYAGDIYLTTSGKICQHWLSQAPHHHPFYAPGVLHGAMRECRNPGGRGERPWCYTSAHSSRWEYCDVPQCTICERYDGAFCSHLPGYDRRDTVYVDRHESQWDQKGQSRAEIWMFDVSLDLFSQNAVLPRVCQEGLKELMCHSTLPLCHSQVNVTRSKLCSEHCRLMKLLQVCPQGVLKKLRIAMRDIGVTFNEPVCGSGAVQPAECLSLQTDLSATTTGQYTGESCFNSSNNGRNYVGMASITDSGATCQPWGPEWPEAEKNYCRNPGQVGLRPWCFTDEEGSKWEYCNIAECVGVTTATDPTKKSLSTATVSVVSTFTVVGFLLIVSSVVLAIIIILFCIHRQNEKLSRDRDPSLFQLRNKREWDYVVNQTYVQLGVAKPQFMEAVENFPKIEKTCIKYVRQLGQGNFGVVFYAKAEGIVENEKETEVAVKTMKEEHSSEGQDDFVREAKLMLSFDHPNIVKIFGVCVGDMPFYLVFEYMDKGDLAQSLRASASSLQRRVMNPFDGRLRSRTESTLSDEPPTLNVDQLVDICKQIAGGMKYLAKKNHVHRDLACRNCLVKSCDWDQTNSGLIIKIGDFGMSQNLYSSDYYRVRGQAVLPVRWMSPEAVIYGKFSTESDVWSFGVVMWEVFSFAMQPYYGTSNEEVTEAIRRHKLLVQPTDCPKKMYEIMQMCWTMQPKLRPSFEELYDILSDCRLSVSSSDQSDSNCYGDDISDLDSDIFYDEHSVTGVEATIGEVTFGESTA